MKDYYSPSERLRLIIDSCAGSQRRFAEMIGADESAVSRLISSNRILTEARIQTICDAFPAVSPQFLRDGTSYPGDISAEAVRSRMEKVVKQKDDMIETLRKEIEMQRKVIEKLVK